jgi:toxin ParE1/3/4
MIGYHFLSAAEAEMVEAALYYDSDSPGLGQHYLTEVHQAVEKLCRFPKIGKALTSRVRSLLISRFPYSLIYYETGESIVIIAVAHHSRRPGYWKGRL